MKTIFVRIAKITAAVSAFTVVAALSAFFTISWIIGSEDTVVVPNLLNRDVVTVLENLTDLGLNTKVRGLEYSADVPKNHVISQDPDPGAEIKKDRDVKIVLSRGSQSVQMPNLASLSYRQAQIIFAENDLCLGVLSRMHQAKTEREEIVAQHPPAGTVIERGSCVDLLVSEGPRPLRTKMPELIGHSLEDALVMIEQRNLVPGAIQTEHRPDRPSRRVLSQTPPAGYAVALRSPVDIVINREGDRLSASDEDGFFRYRVDNGFLKRHIRVELKRDGFTSALYDDYVKPGEEIWLLVPRHKDATLLVYEDDQLVETRVYGDS
jgi:serine/threonine-protein kinase